jgi:hypothetical protein
MALPPSKGLPMIVSSTASTISLLLTYLDDLLIFSENELDHEIHVKKVLTLREAGLQADIKKCEFHVRKTKYLGFIVGGDGIEVDPEKISVLYPILSRILQFLSSFYKERWKDS